MQEQGSRIHVAEITVVPKLNQGVPEKLLEIPACRQTGFSGSFLASFWTSKKKQRK
jgi:hypothetical protein